MTLSPTSSGAGSGSSGVTFSGASVVRTANKAIGAGTDTAVDWDSEEWDTDAYHDNATNPSRMTAPTTARYRVTAAAARTAGGELNVWIRVNGGTAHWGQEYVTASTVALVTVADLNLTAGDYVEMIVFAGGAFTLDCTSVGKSRLQMSRIA